MRVDRDTSIHGSPPHGRGAPDAARYDGAANGLTPAWAGSTISRQHLCVPFWAHPRMGGEHGSMTLAAHKYGGSPPHGRGALGVSTFIHHSTGLTPAWAGSTFWAAGCRGGSRAHPRMGGEHELRPSCIRNSPGSPPHGRGAPGPDVEQVDGGGLTPAWAGSTISRAVAPPACWAHPRMGGEHSPPSR